MLGSLGEITTRTVETLKEIGVNGKNMDTLVADLHDIALRKMDECIESEITQNEWIPRKHEIRKGQPPPTRGAAMKRKRTASIRGTLGTRSTIRGVG